MVLASSPSPSLEVDVGRFVDDQHLAEEVLKEFDPAHRMIVLSTVWSNLMAGRLLLGKSFQVDIPCLLFSFFFYLVFASFSFTFLSFFSFIQGLLSGPVKLLWF